VPATRHRTTGVWRHRRPGVEPAHTIPEIHAELRRVLRDYNGLRYLTKIADVWLDQRLKLNPPPKP
jgi:hypothetical protein